MRLSKLQSKRNTAKATACAILVFPAIITVTQCGALNRHQALRLCVACTKRQCNTYCLLSRRGSQCSSRAYIIANVFRTRCSPLLRSVPLYAAFVRRREHKRHERTGTQRWRPISTAETLSGVPLASWHRLMIRRYLPLDAVVKLHFQAG